MNSKDQAKATREREIFAEFCGAARLPLDPGSVVSALVPNPDIRCSIGGSVHFAELVEITDQGVARSVAESLRTGEPTGGPFSQEQPLREAFRAKAVITYATGGAPLHLVAYYDKQFPPPSDMKLIPESIGEVVREMVAAGHWQQVWVYDTWNKRLLWRYPVD